MFIFYCSRFRFFIIIFIMINNTILRKSLFCSRWRMNFSSSSFISSVSNMSFSSISKSSRTGFSSTFLFYGLRSAGLSRTFKVSFWSISFFQLSKLPYKIQEPYLPSQQVLVPRASRGRPPPTSPRHPLKIDPIWPSLGCPNLMSQGHPNLMSLGRLEMMSRGRPNLTFKGHSWEIN